MASGVLGAASDKERRATRRQASTLRTFIVSIDERINDDTGRDQGSIYTEDLITQLHSLLASGRKVDKTNCDVFSANMS